MSFRVPDGLKLQGVETIEWALGKKLLQGKQKQPPGNLEPLSLMAYDTQSNVFRSWYFDSSGTLARGELTGQWDEGTTTLTFTGSEPNEVTFTSTLRLVSPDRM